MKEEPIFIQCEECQGDEGHWDKEKDEWIPCPGCDGSGYFAIKRENVKPTDVILAWNWNWD